MVIKGLNFNASHSIKGNMSHHGLDVKCLNFDVSIISNLKIINSSKTSARLNSKMSSVIVSSDLNCHFNHFL